MPGIIGTKMPLDQKPLRSSITVDEVSALARRMEIIKQNSESNIEQFFIMQTLPVILNIEQELRGMLADPMLEDMANEIVEKHKS